MNAMDELKQRTEELTRQIGLIRTGLGIDEINKKAEAIEHEIRELRHENNRLTRENGELKGFLSSLITSVEDSRLVKWNDSIRAVGKKMDAILSAGRTGDATVEAETSARLAVVPNLVPAPSENQAEALVESEQGTQLTQSTLQRRPLVSEDRSQDLGGQDPLSPAV